MAYDKNIDYQAKINDAVSRGDYSSAAKYEQQRNEKIKSEGISDYKPTNNYSKYLNSGSGSSRPSSGGSSGKFGSLTGGGYVPGSSFNNPSGSSVSSGNVDYGTMINDAINRGASWGEVQDLLNKRVDKANNNADLNKYAYDSIYANAMDYINQKKYEEYQDQMNSYYDEIAAQQEAAQRAAVEQAVSGLNSQKGDVAQSYDDLYRQLYINRRMAEKNLPQQMAAMGISGGLTESTALGLQTDYTEALRQGEIEKMGTLNDIDQAISDARLTGDINIANNAANLALNKLQSYGDLVSQLQQQQNWANQFAYQQRQDQIANSQWQQQFNRQQMLDQLSRDDVSYDRKMQIAQYLFENTGDASGFRSLGFTDQQIAALQNSYAAAMQSAGVRSGGTGGGGTGGGTGGGYVSDDGYVSDSTPTYTGNETVDMQSVLNLGYGPIDASALAELEKRGEIVSYVEGGKIKFRRVSQPEQSFSFPRTGLYG